MLMKWSILREENDLTSDNFERKWEGERKREKDNKMFYRNIFLRLAILRTLSIQIIYLLGSKDYVILKIN